jgi:RNA polymerase sigma-70 factor (ECF subfamily)
MMMPVIMANPISIERSLVNVADQPPSSVRPVQRDSVPAAFLLNALNDEELALRAQSGSMPAFVELVSRFEGRLYNFLLRRAPTSSDAEDLTQETFLRAWQKIKSYRGSHRFSTWLFTIAARLATDWRRTYARRKAHDQQVGTKHAQRQIETVHEVKTDNSRSIWDVAQLVLNDQQHAAMWLRYVEDLSITEIARVLGKTSIGVRVTLHRSRQILADHVEHSGEFANSERGS